MTRWIKQQGVSECGPVAILNVLKWLGRPVTYRRDGGKWKTLCRCRQDGTSIDDFLGCLNMVQGVDVRPAYPTIQNMEATLAQGGIVVMKGVWVDEGHYFLITDQSPRRFFYVNVGGHGWVTKKWFNQEHLKYRENVFPGFGDAPFAYLIYRSEIVSCRRIA